MSLLDHLKDRDKDRNDRHRGSRSNMTRLNESVLGGIYNGWLRDDQGEDSDQDRKEEKK